MDFHIYFWPLVRKKDICKNEDPTPVHSHLLLACAWTEIFRTMYCQPRLRLHLLCIIYIYLHTNLCVKASMCIGHITVLLPLYILVKILLRSTAGLAHINQHWQNSYLIQEQWKYFFLIFKQIGRSIIRECT